MEHVLVGFFSTPSPIRYFFLLHTVIGVANLIGLAALFTRKGGRAHIFWGIIYVWGTVGCAGTILVSSLWRCLHALDDLDLAHHIYYLHVSLSAIGTVLDGWLVVRYRNRTKALPWPQRAFPFLIVLLAPFAQIANAFTGEWSFVVAPIFAYAATIYIYRFWARAPSHRNEWRDHHRDIMILSIINPFGALLFNVVPRFFHGQLGPGLAWHVPMSIVLPTLLYWRWRRRPQFQNS